MDGIQTVTEGLQTPFRPLTGLATGLLLGSQRERTPGAKAGLRTFVLVLLGSAWLAEHVGNRGLYAIAPMVGPRRRRRHHALEPQSVQQRNSYGPRGGERYCGRVRGRRRVRAGDARFGREPGTAQALRAALLAPAAGMAAALLLIG